MLQWGSNTGNALLMEGDCQEETKTRRITTIITIFALLMLLIPAGVLFADSIDGNPPAESGDPDESVQTVESSETDESEPEETEESEEPEESEEASERAAYVAERNATAESLGIPSGRLNLIDKLAEISGLTREELLPIWLKADVQDIMKEISRYRFEQKGKEVPPGLAADEPEPTEEPDVSEEAEGSAQGKGKGKHN